MELQEAAVETVADCSLTIYVRKESHMYDDFTDRARRVMEVARQAAKTPGERDRDISSVHILIGMLADTSSVAYATIHDAGIPITALQQALRKWPPGARTPGKLTQVAAGIIQTARNDAASVVTTAHLLRALLSSTGAAVYIFSTFYDPGKMLARLEETNAIETRAEPPANALAPGIGAIGLCSRGFLGLITSPGKQPIKYPYGQTHDAWVGIHLGNRGGVYIGQRWFSREPRILTTVEKIRELAGCIADT
jgi:hypothetical protein